MNAYRDPPSFTSTDPASEEAADGAVGDVAQPELANDRIDLPVQFFSNMGHGCECAAAVHGEGVQRSRRRYASVELVLRELTANPKGGGVPKRLADRQAWEQVVILHGPTTS